MTLLGRGGPHLYAGGLQEIGVKGQKAWNIPHVSLKIVSQPGSRGRELREDQAQGVGPQGPRQPEQTGPSKAGKGLGLMRQAAGAGWAGMEGALTN